MDQGKAVKPSRRGIPKQKLEPPPDPVVQGITLQQQGRLAEAEALFRNILETQPANPAALYSLGSILLNSGRVAEAQPCAVQGLQAAPAFAPLWFLQAECLKAADRRMDALASYEQALALDPHYGEVLIHAGVLLRDLHRHKEALLYFQRALEINPDSTTALGNYGILLTEFKLRAQGIAAFERLLQLDPDYPYGLGLLAYEKLHLCDWSGLQEATERITRGIRAGRPVCKTLSYMSLSDSAEDHFLCGRIFASGLRNPSFQPLWQGEAYRHARTRVAYVSPDLREHPVGHLMAGVVEAHDRARFETIGISLGIDDGSRLRTRFIQAFDQFIDARDMTSLQIAELIRNLEVDVAIDLAGYTTDSRTDIFLRRPAPVQINYLGYPGTMALECYDYILADRTIIPEAHASCYSEKPLYLDHCYLPLPTGLELSEPRPRSEYGLPEKGFIFCAFSHDQKIHPDLFAVWMRLLKARPGSVLWLMSRSEEAMRNLGASAEAAGIAPERLVFATRVPRVEDHLARYLVADLFLDTWPYNAHTTAADALRAGLPVITCEGQAFPARVAASLLRTFGLPELVTSSLEAYFDLALSLSRSPRRIQKLRQRLASLDGHPAFGPAFTRSLEKALDSVTPARVEPAAQPAQAAPTAAEEAEAFHREHMAGRPWVAVHLRGSHQGSGSPYAAYHGFVERIIELNPTIGVFLLADDAPAIAEYTARYGDRLLCAPAARSGDRIGAQPGVPLGEEVPVDTLLALKCDYFIGNKESNASLTIQGLKDWAQGFCFLLAGAETSLSPHPQEQPEARACRLCGGPLQEAFSRKVLGKYDVKYYRCLGCASLQTEAPYWLEEAYGPQAERFDTGKASRTLVNFLLMKRLFEILELRPGDRCADFGGGTGLFARLMRDAGFNVFNYDKYGSGEFCSGLTWKAFEHPVKATTVFEVVEHFSDPAAEWEILFRSTSDYIIGSTGLYADQDPDWFYLCPEGGQHIFFHSTQALIHVAAGHGWSAYLIGGYFLLCRRPLAAATVQALQPWISNPVDTVRQTFESWVKNPYACATADSQRQQVLARLRGSGARIALDGTFFRFTSGISRLWRQLLSEWSANGFGDFLVVLDRGHTAPRLQGLTYVDIAPEGWADREADRRMLQEVCDAHGITAFMSSYYTIPLTTPSLLMAYDMIPEVLGFDRDDPQWDHKHEAIRCASHFMAISDSTADDLVRFFPQVDRAEIRRTHCGTDFRTPAPAQVADFKARHGIERTYFLLSGDRSGYKNGILAFKAFALLGDRRKDFALVCTHSLPITDPELLALLGEGKVLPLVLSDEDLQCAYAGAQALVYPSRYEGFGLPVLEAMACSCPVVTCRNSSIPEVAGDAALFVDPDDPAALHAALLSLENPEPRAGLIRKGLRQAERFTWRRMADEVEAAICHWLAPLP